MRRGLVIASAVLGGILLLGSAARAAEGPEVGTATIVDADGHAIEGGGSTTAYTIELSSDPECQGDSANDDYRVNSYLVPESLAPTAVEFDGLGPKPNAYGDYESFRQPLYDTFTTFFVSIQLQNNQQKGEPGRMQAFPMFDFGVYKPGDLPIGRYHLGIACTHLNEITRIWDTEVVVTEGADDEPARIAWSVIGFEPSDDSSSPLVPIVIAVAVVAAAVAVLLLRRRPSVASTPQRRNS